MRKYKTKEIIQEWVPAEIDGKIFMQQQIDGYGMNLFCYAKKENGEWKVDPNIPPFAFNNIEEVK
jgi:hypothetical protein